MIFRIVKFDIIYSIDFIILSVFRYPNIDCRWQCNSPATHGRTTIDHHMSNSTFFLDVFLSLFCESKLTHSTHPLYHFFESLLSTSYSISGFAKNPFISHPFYNWLYFFLSGKVDTFAIAFNKPFIIRIPFFLLLPQSHPFTSPH